MGLGLWFNKFLNTNELSFYFCTKGAVYKLYIKGDTNCKQSGNSTSVLILQEET